MIYTLDYLEKQAQGIQSAWNGEDDRFMYEGEMLPVEYVDRAKELEKRLQQVRDLIMDLSL
jgi:hypothetical protein